jgi:Holliday junction resolvasome RuvABC endonuclease subunit
MNILALDLGTKTGWALHVRGGKISGGTVNCAPGVHAAGQRWVNFRNHLAEMKRAAGEIQVVYFEDIKMHKGVIAAHVYGGFKAQLELWCMVNNVQMIGVGFGAIKKNWTGKGNADKQAMIAEARKRGFAPVDDNHADALAILAYGLNAEGLVRQPIGRAA